MTSIKITLIKIEPASLAQESRELTTCERPSEIVMLDALPASSTGKILKHRLGDRAHDQAQRRSSDFT